MKHEDIAASRLDLPLQPISHDVLAEKYLKKEKKTEDQLIEIGRASCRERV